MVASGGEEGEGTKEGEEGMSDGGGEGRAEGEAKEGGKKGGRGGGGGGKVKEGLLGHVMESYQIAEHGEEGGEEGGGQGGREGGREAVRVVQVEGEGEGVELAGKDDESSFQGLVLCRDGGRGAREEGGRD